MDLEERDKIIEEMREIGAKLLPLANQLKNSGYEVTVFLVERLNRELDMLIQVKSHIEKRVVGKV